jgi:hypothetical protein
MKNIRAIPPFDKTNYPGYFIDKLGTVYSVKRKNKLTKLRNTLWRSGGAGPYYVRFLVSENGKAKRFMVAELVLHTFISPRPRGMLACHGPRGKLDNALDNVYWATQRENMLDKRRDGTDNVGERHPLHKLNELQVRIIRRAYGKRNKDGLSTPKLAEIFGVNYVTIYSIVTRKNWKHLK